MGRTKGKRDTSIKEKRVRSSNKRKFDWYMEWCNEIAEKTGVKLDFDTRVKKGSSGRQGKPKSNLLAVMMKNRRARLRKLRESGGRKVRHGSDEREDQATPNPHQPSPAASGALASDVQPPASAVPLPSPEVIDLTDDTSSVTARDDVSSIRAISPDAVQPNPVAPIRDWNHLDIVPDPQSGRLPNTSEEQGQADLLDFLREARSLVNADKLSLVRSIKMEVRPEILVQEVDLLRGVAPNLQSLKLVGPPKANHLSLELFGVPKAPDDTNARSLDNVLFELYDVSDRADGRGSTLRALGQPYAYFGVTFSALQTVNIRAGAMRFPESIALFLRMAPNVEHLTLEVHNCADGTPFGEELERRGVTQGLTQIRNLQMSFIDRTRDSHSFAPLLSLLKKSPLVERLSLDYTSHSHDDLNDTKVHICNMQNLRDLHWSVEWSKKGNAGCQFRSLQRLAMPLKQAYPVRTAPDPANISPLPFSRSAVPNSRSLSLPATRALSSPIGLSNYLPSELITSPRILRPGSARIRTSTLSTTPPNSTPTSQSSTSTFPPATSTLCAMTGKSSYTPGCSSLPTLEEDGDIEWYPYADTGAMQKDGLDELLVMWVDLTDYDGKAVPLKVLEEMRVVEGASEEDWEKRGVEVGKEAWKVLLDWRRGRRWA